MMELLTGDPVYCPDKSPPGLVDRVCKALEAGTLKGAVDRSAHWIKSSAKAYAKLARACCSASPDARPSLKEVANRVTEIQDIGRPHNREVPARAGAGAGASTGGSGATNSLLVELSDEAAGQDPATDSVAGQGVQLGYDSPSSNPFLHGGAVGGGDGAVMASPSHCPPPTYSELVIDPGGTQLGRVSGLLPGHEKGVEGVREGGGGTLTDPGMAGGGGMQPPGGVVGWAGAGAVAKGLDLLTGRDGSGASGVQNGEVSGAASTGQAGEFWGEVTGVFQKVADGATGAGGVDGVATAGGRGGQGDAVEGQMSAMRSDSPPLPPREELVSKTHRSSLADYAVGLPELLFAVKRGGVLSSNPRLMCLCHRGQPDSLPSLSSSLSSGGDTGARLRTRGAQAQGFVSVLDLWHRGRTVRYPAAAKTAAISPNRTETVIAVYGRGALQVFSLLKGSKIREQLVPSALCLWRWLSTTGLALVTAELVLYWNTAGRPTAGGVGKSGEVAGGGTAMEVTAGGGDPSQAATARLCCPTPAFKRRHTRAKPRPDGGPPPPQREYEYHASVDGKWGMLCVAVAPVAPAGRRDGLLGGGSNGSSGGVVGGGAAGEWGSCVRVDLYSFERRETFSFDALGAALVTMPGSSPPTNLLAMVVRNDMGLPELRVLDLDRSLAQAEGEEAMRALVEREEGWLLVTTHVIAEKDICPAEAHRVVESLPDSGEVAGVTGGGLGSAEGPVVSPLVFLRQWTANTNVLFTVGCHGLLLLLDVVTGAELGKMQPIPGRVVEVAVDPHMGDLVVVSAAGGGGVHRVTVNAAGLREQVELEHSDPELAARVSAPTGYQKAR
ncbi:unnamed protein product [Discosporangium mesarthrocarpum]